MYTSTLFFGLAAIAATSVNALATPGMSPAKRHTFNTEGDCSPQPLGSGPSVSPDTDSAFVSDPTLSDISTQAVTPAGWAVIYQDLQAASSDSGYIGNEEITSYDPGYCASQCCNFWAGCTSFNIYFERNPVVDPGANCTNPGSTTRIKCSFWSVDLTQGDATNDGQYCADFHVVIAGSNAYKGGCPKPSTTAPVVSTTPVTTPVNTTPVNTTPVNTTPVNTTPVNTTPVAPTTTPKTSSTLATTTKFSTTKLSTTKSTTTKAVPTTAAPPPPPPPPPAPPAPPGPPAPAPPGPAPPKPNPPGPAPPAPAPPGPAPPAPAPPKPAPPGPAPPGPAPPGPAPPAPAPPAPAPAKPWGNWGK